MYHQIVTILVLIAAVYSFPSGDDDNEEKVAKDSYETLMAPILAPQQDEGYPRSGSFRIRTTRPKSLVTQSQSSERGVCPNGPSLPIRCDPKRPWPACPPQSYCYATNSVELGSYYCCPV